MKTLKRIAIVNAVIVAVTALSAFIWVGSAREKKAEHPVKGKGFAVLELFTSEGCSSCPPAEELLAKMEKESNGKPVYVLGYHVDYFDNLGWQDVFGSPENTKRQKKYSSWLSAQIYTPQLVINGAQEFIGSNESDVRNAINKQLVNKQHTASLAFDTRRDGDVLKIDYETKDTQASDDLLFALVQKNGSTHVQRGENAGLKLSHVQIVRKTLTLSLNNAKSGIAVLKIPKSSNAEKWEVIGMVQHKTTGIISAVNASATF
ncbi:DUF1223 domain-containing protein [Pedobacter psychrodurus]|uniref:DUF1223 domain-containing protein n=1 Tax=Pedobacter psychrodurus TaxID=2530456 RepID=A0A4R0PEL2_9SPHI|nr:DUF1223 domain-containing protein [Pedobacter psychrodurus]TCD14645.1 DUF1223 domain-containing protein [Pedobacter psychrodurus]